MWIADRGLRYAGRGMRNAEPDRILNNEQGMLNVEGEDKTRDGESAIKRDELNSYAQKTSRNHRFLD